jgi:hypothetical protein
MIFSDKNVTTFLSKFPTLDSALDVLDKNNITYAIGGSGCLFVLGNERIPDDVDIMLLDSDHDTVDKLFAIESYQYTSSVESVRNSNPGGDHDIQMTSHLKFTIENREYDMSLTVEMVENRFSITHNNRTYWFMAPSDVVLVKALLQRGSEVGKRDLEDVVTFIEHYKDFDFEYFNQRIESLGATDRVRKLFELINK